MTEDMSPASGFSAKALPMHAPKQIKAIERHKTNRWFMNWTSSQLLLIRLCRFKIFALCITTLRITTLPTKGAGTLRRAVRGRAFVKIPGGRHMECAYYLISGGRHMECAYYFGYFDFCRMCHYAPYLPSRPALAMAKVIKY
jgi:hypothetical protein